jgi:hypothetical protein
MVEPKVPRSLVEVVIEGMRRMSLMSGVEGFQVGVGSKGYVGRIVVR